MKTDIVNMRLWFWIYTVTLGFFLSQTAPEIYWKDGGDFATSAFNLSAAHPTGYPLYIISTKTLSFIPFGNIAYRVSIFSAVMAALTMCILTGFTARMLHSRWLAFASAGMFMFSLQFWYETSSLEIYVLNICFLVAMLYLTRCGGERCNMLFYFLFGISITNHLTPILWIPLFVLLKPDLVFYLKKRWCTALILFMAGVSIYLFLPCRAVVDPFPNFGDTRSWHRFVEHVTAKHYKHGMFAQSVSSIVSDRFPYLLWLFSLQWHASAIIMGCIGWIYAVIKRHPLSWMVPLGCAGLCAFMLYEMGPNFFTPGYMLFSMVIALGIHCILNILKRYRIVGYTVSVILVCILISTTIANNVSICCKRNDWLPYLYGKSITQQVQNNGIVFTDSDSAGFILWYILKVEKTRPDVLHIHRPALTWGPYYWKKIGMEELLAEPLSNRNLDIYRWGPETIIKLFLGNRPMVWEPVKDSADPFYAHMYPGGLFYNIHPEPLNTIPETLVDNYTDIWSRLVSMPGFYRKLWFSPYGQESCGAASNYCGFMFMSRNMPKQAIDAYERSIDLNPYDHVAQMMLVKAYTDAFQMETDPVKKEIYLEKAIWLKELFEDTPPKTYRVYL